MLAFTIVLTAGETPPSVPKHNDFLNLIKSITVRFGASGIQHTYSATDKYFMDLFDFGTLPQKPALATPAANGTSTMEYKTEIDFALNRRVLSDFRALFNAPAKDSVFIEIEWGDITDIYGTVADGSIDSSTELSVSLLEAFEDSRVKGQSLEDALAKGQDIRIGVEEVNIKAAHGSYDDDIQEIDILPVPSVILQHWLFAKKNVTDENSEFSDDVIDQIKIANTSSAGEIIVQEYWARMTHPVKTDFGLESLPAGILPIDWLDQRQIGLQNKDVEALKLRILNAAPAAGKENSLRILKKFIPLAPTPNE